MKPSSRYALLLLAAGLVAVDAPAQAQTFTLESPDLKSGAFDNKHVLNGFGCNGQNVSPTLEWRNVPSGAKSLALQVYDPDAPTGSGFWHWAVYNIPPTATGLPQGAGNAAVGFKRQRQPADIIRLAIAQLFRSDPFVYEARNLTFYQCDRFVQVGGVDSR